VVVVVKAVLVPVLLLVVLLEAPLAVVDEAPEVEPPQALSVRATSDSRAREPWRGERLIIR